MNHQAVSYSGQRTRCTTSRCFSFLCLLLVLVPAFMPATAAAQGSRTASGLSPSEMQDSEMRGALKMLETLGDASTEEAQAAQARQADDAIRVFQKAGRDGVPMLREALQKGHRNPAYLIIVASLLVLAEGPSGIEAARVALDRVPATVHPDLFYRWLHICLRFQSKESVRVIDRLLDIPVMEIKLSELETGVHSPALAGFALSAAGDVGKKRVLEILSNPGSVSDARWRNLMADLSHLPSPEIARKLEKAIPRVTGESRRAAVWALGKCDDERSVAYLADLYLHEKDPIVRREVIFVLGEMSHVGAKTVIVRALGDPNEDVRSNAIGSLAALQLPDAGEILKGRFLAEKSPLVRPNYVSALIRLRPAGYREMLQEAGRKWPSFAPFIDNALKNDKGGDPLGPPSVLGEVAGDVLDEPRWERLRAELEDSGGLTIALNRKTIVMTATEADAAYLETLLPKIAGNLTLDNYKAFEAYQEVYRLIRRKWRKDPRPSFQLPPVWYGNRPVAAPAPAK